MPQYRWIDPAQQAFVERHQLDNLGALLSRSDGQRLAPQHRWRDIVRLSLVGDQGQPRVVYIKREHARWKDLLRHAAMGQGFWSLARWEFEILQRVLVSPSRR